MRSLQQKLKEQEQQLTIYQKQILDLKEDQQIELQQQQQNYRIELEDKQDQIDLLCQKNNSLQQELKDISQQLIVLEKQNRKTKDDYDRIEKQNQLSIDDQQQQIRQLENHNFELDLKIGQLEQINMDLKKSKELAENSYKVQVQQLQQREDKNNAEIMEINSVNQEQQQKIEKLQEQLVQVSNSMNDQIGSLNGQICRLKVEYQGQLDLVGKDKRVLQQLGCELRQEIYQKEQDLVEVRKMLEEQQQQGEVYVAKIKELKKSVRKLGLVSHYDQKHVTMGILNGNIQLDNSDNHQASFSHQKQNYKSNNDDSDGNGDDNKQQTSVSRYASISGQKQSQNCSYQQNQGEQQLVNELEQNLMYLNDQYDKLSLRYQAVQDKQQKVQCRRDMVDLSLKINQLNDQLFKCRQSQL